jgi:hypothetical protein
MKANGIMHMAKLRKPSNEQAHATPKRSYLFNEVSTVFLGKLSTRDVALLPHIASDATLWRHTVVVVDGAGSIFRGPFSLSINTFTTYIGLAANGRTVPNKLLEQADAAIALAANTSYASTR